MKEELKNLQIGDRVFDLVSGWGVITDIIYTFPGIIEVKFQNSKSEYSLKGILFGGATQQSLFTYDPFEEKEEKLPCWKEFEINGDRVNRYAIFKNTFDQYLTFKTALCDLSEAKWLSEIGEEEKIIEMTLKEITQKLGIKNLKIIQ